MDDPINTFLQNQSVMTVCYADDDNNPFCFPCFFAFNRNQRLLYFKTSPSSNHSLVLVNKPGVSGTILPDKLNVLALKGVQFQGRVLPPGHQLMHHAARCYYQKFPLAMVIPGVIYAIELSEIKLTDGAKGFGKKMIWRKEEVVQL